MFGSIIIRYNQLYRGVVMNKNRILFSVIVIWGLVMSCNMPFGSSALPEQPQDSYVTETPSIASPSNAQSNADSVSPTFTPVTPVVVVITATLNSTETPCFPSALAPTPVNIRSGPGTVYEVIGGLNKDQSAKIAGKSPDGTWWYIEIPSSSGSYGWVGGTVVNASCVPSSLVVIPAPPTPLPAAGTCKENYVHRLINASDKVCVPPASKSQANADNAAAASRTLVGTYGADACAAGYVWREAYTGDKVCVTAATRTQAQADNAAAASRVDPVTPPNCIVGFVWREANGLSDKICVTPAIRTETAADNAAAASRVAGAKECVTGYVWRLAFSGDKVCVTPAVKNQVDIDNAAAPSRTW